MSNVTPERTRSSCILCLLSSQSLSYLFYLLTVTYRDSIGSRNCYFYIKPWENICIFRRNAYAEKQKVRLLHLARRWPISKNKGKTSCMWIHMGLGQRINGKSCLCLVKCWDLVIFFMLNQLETSRKYDVSDWEIHAFISLQGHLRCNNHQPD